MIGTWTLKLLIFLTRMDVLRKSRKVRPNVDGVTGAGPRHCKTV